MEGWSRHETAEVETYRRRARLLGRAARAHEESANLHELYARRCFYEDLVVAAQGQADHARETAARSQSRSDDLYARAADA